MQSDSDHATPRSPGRSTTTSIRSAKTPRERLNEIVHTLYYEIYETCFGGRDRGAFRITRRQLADRLGRPDLDPIVLQSLKAAAAETGLMMVDVGNGFACIELRAVDALRRVPNSVLREAFVPADDDLDARDEDQDDEDDEDEDDEEDDAL